MIPVMNTKTEAMDFLKYVTAMSLKADKGVGDGAGSGYVGVIDGHVVKLATHFGERHWNWNEEAAKNIGDACRELKAGILQAAEKLLDAKGVKDVSDLLNRQTNNKCSLLTRRVALAAVKAVTEKMDDGDASAIVNVIGNQTITASDFASVKDHLTDVSADKRRFRLVLAGLVASLTHGSRKAPDVFDRADNVLYYRNGTLTALAPDSSGPVAPLSAEDDIDTLLDSLAHSADMDDATFRNMLERLLQVCGTPDGLKFVQDRARQISQIKVAPEPIRMPEADGGITAELQRQRFGQLVEQTVLNSPDLKAKALALVAGDSLSVSMYSIDMSGAGAFDHSALTYQIRIPVGDARYRDVTVRPEIRQFHLPIDLGTQQPGTWEQMRPEDMDHNRKLVEAVVTEVEFDHENDVRLVELANAVQTGWWQISNRIQGGYDEIPRFYMNYCADMMRFGAKTALLARELGNEPAFDYDGNQDLKGLMNVERETLALWLKDATDADAIKAKLAAYDNNAPEVVQLRKRVREQFGNPQIVGTVFSGVKSLYEEKT